MKKTIPASDKPLAEPATLLDVARLAGVSASTVSRILNGTARVTEDKRLAVETAIERLQFRPNFAAQSLRSGSTRTIGVLTQELESPYFTRGARGIELGLEGSHYAPIVVPGHWNVTEELDRARLLIARRVDAMVILGGNLSDEQVAEMARKLPIAITGRELDAPNVFSFHCDQVEGARAATHHLIELGHRRIALITAPLGIRPGRERVNGYRAALKEAGLPVDETLIGHDYQTTKYGLSKSLELLRQPNRPTAIIAGGDEIFYGVLRAVRQLNLAVPGDVSIVGADNRMLSDVVSPMITIIDRDMELVGDSAADLLVKRMSGALTSEPVHVHLPSEVMLRSSTGRPRSG